MAVNIPQKNILKPLLCYIIKTYQVDITKSYFRNKCFIWFNIIYIYIFYTSMFRLQWDNNLWSIKEDYLRNISVFLFIHWKSLVSKLALVTNILFLLLTNILHYFLLCSIKESKWYRFETIWGWVDDDRIVLFGWTITLLFNLIFSEVILCVSHWNIHSFDSFKLLIYSRIN